MRNESDRDTEHTASRRRLRARLAAHAMHSRNDSREITAAARSAFLGRFEDEVDPDRRLTEAERARRAKHARIAHFTRLALRSAQVRAARRTQAEAHSKDDKEDDGHE